MAHKISAELSVVAATPELEKSVAAELDKADGDLEALLKKAEDDERKDTEDNTESLS